MQVKGFTLVNEDKVERALHGSLNGENQKIGGVANPDETYDDDALIAEYDRLGGLIRRENDTVKMGSFYDFKKRAVRAKPEIVLTYLINGRTIEVKDGEPVPGIVNAARIMAEEDATVAPKKRTSRKKKAVEEGE